MEKIRIKLLIDYDRRKDEGRCFFLYGINRLSDIIEIVENEDDADYVFCHRWRSDKEWLPPTLNNQNKLVIFDYTDYFDNADYFDNYGHYFKRSVAKKNYNLHGLINKLEQPNFHPLPYSIKYVDNKDVHEVLDLSNIEKTRDISCFFNPSEYRDLRGNVAKVVQDFCRSHGLRCHIGLSGSNDHSYNGRENFLKTYYEIMKSSKIVVTCNPNNWEGDWRLFESLSVGTCVFVDKMLIPMENPLIDGKHVVVYNDLQDLSNKLDKYYNNDELIGSITRESKEFVYKYHKPEDRILYALKKIGAITQ